MQNKVMMLTLAGMLLAGAAMAGEGWLTDFEKAKQTAKEQKRPVLADFTGSDWCGWCIKLDKEVFSKEEFRNYAKDKLVLFMADFPRNKELPEADKKQNSTLMEKYGVMGFPTVLLLDADGNLIARTGYRPGGPAAYIRHLQELLKKQ